MLGIDPGSVVAGWGVVAAEGGRLGLTASGALRPKGKDLPTRLVALHRALAAVLDAHPVEAVAVEAVFHARHARAALVLGHARGVLLLAAAQRSLPVFEYPPAAVKKAVTGDGAAGKEAVRRMVGALLGAPIAGPLDASDALAVAITHAQIGRLQARIEGARAGAAGRGGRHQHPALRLPRKGGV